MESPPSSFLRPMTAVRDPSSITSASSNAKSIYKEAQAVSVFIQSTMSRKQDVYNSPALFKARDKYLDSLEEEQSKTYNTQTKMETDILNEKDLLHT